MMQKFDIIIPTGQDEYDMLHKVQYHDDPITDYRPLIVLRGKHVIQHVIDEIAEADNSHVAEELGLRGSIGSITIVGKKQELEQVIQPRQHPINVVDFLGDKAIENVGRGFSSLFPDCQMLPDIGKAYYYVTGAEMQSQEQFDSHIQARAEVIAAIAARMHSADMQRLNYMSSNEAITGALASLTKRGIIKGSIEDHLVEMSPAISNNLNLGRESMSFLEPERYDYFLEYFTRLEKEVMVIGVDTPILNPGIMVFLKQCQKVDADFKMGVSTDEFFSPFYEQVSKRRISASRAYKHKFDSDFDGCRGSYIPMDYLAKVIDLIVLKPNKIEKPEMLDMAVSLKKQKDMRNKIKAIWEAPRKAKILLGLMYAANRINSFGLHYGLPFSPANLLRRYTPSSAIEAAASEVIGCDFRIVVSPYAAIGLDLDWKHDLYAFEKYLDKWKQMQWKVDYRPFV